MASGPADAFADALALVRQWRPRDPATRPAGLPSLPASDGASDPATQPAAKPSGAIASAQALIAARELDSVTLTERSLAAIAERNDQLYAFAEILEVEALDRARKLDALPGPRGPLHGIPVSVKDLYSVKGATTRAGSLAFERRDAIDSSVVRRLREAGAVLLGKTSLHEFAMGVIAPASRNPLDPTRIAGGSSSGAAIAAATGMGMAAIGTDTRGSIRIPAAFCGVVGLKPTAGMVELDHVVALSWSLDHFGVIAGSVDDAALVLGVARGEVGPPPAGQARRIGVPRAAWQGVDAQVERALELTIDSLVASGCELVELDRPNDEDFDRANLASIVVSRCEAAAYHDTLGLDRSLYSADIRAQLAATSAATAQDFIDAQRLRQELRSDLTAVFDGVDVMLMPTVPIVAPPHEGAEKLPLVLTRNVAIWSFVGFPALSLPAGTPEGALPVGVQLVGPPWGEAAILSAGRAAELTAR